MNNIYVEELPKDCGYCVFCKQTEYYYYCDKLHTKLGYFNKEKDCPLKPLTDRLAEERKRVVQDIWKEFEQRLKNKTEDMSVIKVCMMINDVLDQIERNGNDNK